MYDDSFAGLVPRSVDAQDRARHEVISLMSVSLALASVSVLAALTAFYWFVRMRRTFRHDLIMLLIQSDMFKAFWLVLCPIIYFIKGPIDSKSAFCQVSGFFLSVSIEASDIAVLMIALHTALFMLWPQRSGGETGLYPYRRIAYSLWAIIPIVLAAIVPISGGSFLDNGPNCYLPISPAWYRSALSWIPRYIVFGVITLTYAGVYLRVGFQIRRFGKVQRRASTQSGHSYGWRKISLPHLDLRSPSAVPATPPVAEYSGRASFLRGSDQRGRHPSLASTISMMKPEERHARATPVQSSRRRSSISWNLSSFRPEGATPPALADRDEAEAASPQSEAFPCQVPPLQHPSPTHRATPSRSPERLPGRDSSWARNESPWQLTPPTSRQGSGTPMAAMMSTLRQGTTEEEGTAAPSSELRLPPEATEESMRRSRERMQRQLRLLFVYPAVYVLTWIAPFVSHVLSYDDGSQISAARGDGSALGQKHEEPFALQVVSIASLCIGAAVDCGFFMGWERPWRYLRGGFWEELAMRLRIAPDRHRDGSGSGSGGRRVSLMTIVRGRSGSGRDPGKTREELINDARMAQQRRDQEAAELLRGGSLSGGGGGIGGGGSVGAGGVGGGGIAGSRSAVRAPRQWWDIMEDETPTGGQEPGGSAEKRARP